MSFQLGELFSSLNRFWTFVHLLYAASEALSRKLQAKSRNIKRISIWGR